MVPINGQYLVWEDQPTRANLIDVGAIQERPEAGIAINFLA
jgi:hypothetical protein